MKAKALLKGKTPLAMEILSILIGRGWKPALISRGYRGKWERSGGILSDGRSLFGSWKESGDEPYMIARRFPGAGVLIGRDRLNSCRKARDLGFNIAILDDGFQYVRLHRDLDIVLVDPREHGPLRESISALVHADMLLTDSDVSSEAGLRAAFPSAAVFGCRTKAEGIVDLRTGQATPIDSIAGKRVVAFSGIASPRRFFDLLRQCGADVVAELPFPDHHAYPESSLFRIARILEKSGAGAAVTTEKDSVKIPVSGTPLDPYRIGTLKIRLDIEAGFRERLDREFVLPSPGRTVPE